VRRVLLGLRSPILNQFHPHYSIRAAASAVPAMESPHASRRSIWSFLLDSPGPSVAYSRDHKHIGA